MLYKVQIWFSVLKFIHSEMQLFWLAGPSKPSLFETLCHNPAVLLNQQVIFITCAERIFSIYLIFLLIWDTSDLQLKTHQLQDFNYLIILFHRRFFQDYWFLINPLNTLFFNPCRLLLFQTFLLNWWTVSLWPRRVFKFVQTPLF